MTYVREDRKALKAREEFQVGARRASVNSTVAKEFALPAPTHESRANALIHAAMRGHPSRADRRLKQF